MLVKNRTNQAELETHQTPPALVEKKIDTRITEE